MRKLVILGLAFFLVVLGASAVWATPTVINDTPSVGTYTAIAEFNTAGNLADATHIYDVIGVDAFKTNKVTVTSGNLLKIEIVTDFPAAGYTESGVTWTIADIGLSATTTTANYDSKTIARYGSPTSPFELGINMSNAKNGTATLETVSQWNSTYTNVSNIGASWLYGGAWDVSTNGNPATYVKPVESTITAGTVIDNTGTVTYQDLGLDPDNHAFHQYLVTILFANYTGLYDTAFNLIWATAICGNDVVEGHVDAQVPIPPSALLLGSGLLGLAGLAWRKKRLG